MNSSTSLSQTGEGGKPCLGTLHYGHIDENWGSPSGQIDSDLGTCAAPKLSGSRTSRIRAPTALSAKELGDRGVGKGSSPKRGGPSPCHVSIRRKTASPPCLSGPTQTNLANLHGTVHLKFPEPSSGPARRSGAAVPAPSPLRWAAPARPCGRWPACAVGRECR